MDLDEFIIALQSIQKERSHHFKGKMSIDFFLENSDNEVELLTVEPYMLIGCGCWAGAKLYLKVKE